MSDPEDEFTKRRNQRWYEVLSRQLDTPQHMSPKYGAEIKQHVEWLYSELKKARTRPPEPPNVDQERVWQSWTGIAPPQP